MLKTILAAAAMTCLMAAPAFAQDTAKPEEKPMKPAVHHHHHVVHHVHHVVHHVHHHHHHAAKKPMEEKKM
jgi:hypothetical protein